MSQICKRCKRYNINPFRSRLYCDVCLDYIKDHMFKIRHERIDNYHCRQCNRELDGWSRIECNRCLKRERDNRLLRFCSVNIMDELISIKEWCDTHIKRK